MMIAKDYYRILGLNPNASEDEIKKAYRRLVMKYHPDRNRDDPKSEERLKEINEAYHILGNSGKKREYDLSYRRHVEDPFIEKDFTNYDLDAILRVFFSRGVEVSGRSFCKRRGLGRRGCGRWRWSR